MDFNCINHTKRSTGKTNPFPNPSYGNWEKHWNTEDPNEEMLRRSEEKSNSNDRCQSQGSRLFRIAKANNTPLSDDHPLFDSV